MGKQKFIRDASCHQPDNFEIRVTSSHHHFNSQLITNMINSIVEEETGMEPSCLRKNLNFFNNDHGKCRASF